MSADQSAAGPGENLAKVIFDLAYVTGRFRLRSGAIASECFDKYRFGADPRVPRQIAERLADLVPEGIDALAGLEMGGIRIATMLSQVTGLPALFIRRKAKDYGTCKFAEGGEVRGRRLLIVEDVVTSGGQTIESAKALRSEGALVDRVVCVIDRESGGPENLRKEGLMLRALFTMSALKAASAGRT